MYGKAQMESPTTPHSLFFYRQFWSALKLFRNILAWQVTDTQFATYRRTVGFWPRSAHPSF